MSAPIEEAEDFDLEIRKSFDLTPDNARFSLSSGGLVSLNLSTAEYGREYFERVIVIRCFPLSNPSEFISVRQPDSRFKGRGTEIGIIRRLSDFDEQTGRIICTELEERYFSPEITKITSVKEKFGYYYWDVMTSSGSFSFVLNNPYSDIRMLENGSVSVLDMDGNRFTITDPSKLDRQSYRKLEVYI